MEKKEIGEHLARRLARNAPAWTAYKRSVLIFLNETPDADARKSGVRSRPYRFEDAPRLSIESWYIRVLDLAHRRPRPPHSLVVVACPEAEASVYEEVLPLLPRLIERTPACSRLLCRIVDDTLTREAIFASQRFIQDFLPKDRFRFGEVCPLEKGSVRQRPLLRMSS